jgi:hypothetical protein
LRGFHMGDCSIERNPVRIFIDHVSNFRLRVACSASPPNIGIFAYSYVVQLYVAIGA